MKTFHTYLLGFLFSIGLTLASFALVAVHLDSNHVWPNHTVAMSVLVVLAVSQFFIQIAYFLHLGRDAERKWDRMLFVFALVVVGIIVGGTMWIMHHLSTAHGEPREIFTGGELSPQAQND